MEKLTLPAPANALFHSVYGVFEDLIRPVSPGGTLGRLGGGTTLAARWRHRRSTDVDITVPVGTGLGRYDPKRDPRLVERMAALGATHVDVRLRSFTFTFANGKLDLVEMDPQLRVGHALAEVDSLPMEVLSNGQILCGKLQGRGNILPERDVFDIAVAAELDAAALAAAVNHQDADYRREIVHRIRAQADQYPATAKTVLDPLDAQWRPLLSHAPAHAAAAIEEAAYTTVAVAYGEQGIELRLEADKGATNTLRFATGDEFAQAILQLGLEPCFLNALGTLDAVQRHMDEQLEAWRRNGKAAPRVEPPYRGGTSTMAARNRYGFRPIPAGRSPVSNELVNKMRDEPGM